MHVKNQNPNYIHSQINTPALHCACNIHIYIHILHRWICTYMHTLYKTTHSILKKMHAVAHRLPKFSNQPKYGWYYQINLCDIYIVCHIIITDTKIVTNYNHNRIVPLDTKGCISHFTKWQIHPFVTEGTTYEPSTCIRTWEFKLCIQVRHLGPAAVKFQCWKYFLGCNTKLRIDTFYLQAPSFKVPVMWSELDINTYIYLLCGLSSCFNP